MGDLIQCKFFLRGCCRYGDNCRFYHGRPGGNGAAYQSGPFQTQSTNTVLPSPSAFNTFSFALPAQQPQQPSVFTRIQPSQPASTSWISSVTSNSQSQWTNPVPAFSSSNSSQVHDELMDSPQPSVFSKVQPSQQSSNSWINSVTSSGQSKWTNPVPPPLSISNNSPLHDVRMDSPQPSVFTRTQPSQPTSTSWISSVSSSAQSQRTNPLLPPVSISSSSSQVQDELMYCLDEELSPTEVMQFEATEFDKIPFHAPSKRFC